MRHLVILKLLNKVLEECNSKGGMQNVFGKSFCLMEVIERSTSVTFFFHCFFSRDGRLKDRISIPLHYGVDECLNLI